MIHEQDEVLHDEVLFEGETASPRDWQERLNCDAEEISQLIGIGALKRISTEKPELRLDFVGLLALKESVNFVLPKVFGPSARIPRTFDVFRTLRCIQRYQARSGRGLVRFRSADEGFYTEAGSKVSLFLQLLAWTRDHGLHEEETISRSDELNHVDWGDTFACGMVLHFRTGSAFSEYHGRRETGRPSELAVAQALALLDLHEGLGIVGRLWLSRHDPLFEMCASYILNTDQFCKSLDAVRSTVFEADLHATKDHDRELITILKRWLQTSSISDNFITLFGVNAFHVVWEDICTVALGHVGTADHSSIAAQAKHFLEGKEIVLASQRPDHLFEKAGEILIADAKWYRAWAGELPPLHDVIKQIMYEMTIDMSKKVNANVFLLPSIDSGRLITRIGSTKMVLGDKPDARFPTIEILAVDWDAVVNAYIAGLELTELRELLAENAAA